MESTVALASQRVEDQWREHGEHGGNNTVNIITRWHWTFLHVPDLGAVIY